MSPRRSKGVSADFSVDNAQSDYMAGYIEGIADYVDTPDYLGSAVDFVSTNLQQRFEMDLDSIAALNPDAFYHVYEWGETYGDRSSVGKPHRRLWKLTTRRQGATGLGVGFVFLPSVKEVPLHPVEEKYGVEARHTFTWKAPVMEYGQTVVIEPVEAMKGRLTFFWEKKNKFVTTTKTIRTQLDHRVQGQFTGYFLKWWATDAPHIYSREIKPILEKNVVKRGPGGRFLPGRTKEQSRALASGKSTGGIAQDLRITHANQRRGEAEAIKTMRKIAAGYKQNRGGWDNYRD